MTEFRNLNNKLKNNLFLSFIFEKEILKTDNNN
jgi:hypothetical protein